MRRGPLAGTVLMVAGLLGTACGADPEPAATLPAPPAFAGTPRDVVVDTDLGADDAVALIYLLRRPEVRVRAITVSGTGLVHCPGGAAVAQAILALTGHPEVPVGCGRTAAVGGHPFPAAWRERADRAVGLSVAPEKTAADVAELIVRTTGKSNGGVHVLVLGPLTNVADALQRGAEPVDVTLMGGVIEGAGNVDGVPGVEWNLHADPHAAAAVFASRLPITVVTLDATDDVPVERSYVDQALDAAAGKDAAWAAQRMTELTGHSFWDPLAAAALVDPAIIRTRTAAVTVDASSGALREAAGGTAVRVAESADRAAFERDLLAALAAKPATTGH